MTRKIIRVLLICVMIPALFLTSCKPTAEVEDTTWVLESYFYGEHGHFHSALEDTEITALFNSTEGQVTGSAGCNSYFAGYEIKKDEISIIGPIGATEMYCIEPGVMDQESRYLSLLETIETFYISEGKLVILSSGDPILVFVAQ